MGLSSIEHKRYKTEAENAIATATGPVVGVNSLWLREFLYELDAYREYVMKRKVVLEEVWPESSRSCRKDAEEQLKKHCNQGQSVSVSAEWLSDTIADHRWWKNKAHELPLPR